MIEIAVALLEAWKRSSHDKVTLTYPDYQAILAPLTPEKVVKTKAGKPSLVILDRLVAMEYLKQAYQLQDSHGLRRSIRDRQKGYIQFNPNQARTRVRGLPGR